MSVQCIVQCVQRVHHIHRLLPSPFSRPGRKAEPSQGKVEAREKLILKGGQVLNTMFSGGNPLHPGGGGHTYVGWQSSRTSRHVAKPSQQLPPVSGDDDWCFLCVDRHRGHGGRCHNSWTKSVKSSPGAVTHNSFSVPPGIRCHDP